MRDSELQIDRSCHVLYSKPCKKEILAKITLHYPEVEREAVWEQVQLRYAELLSKWRTDLGGKKNFHNGVGGTYDCIAIMCFYDVCRDVVTFREMEEIEENLILPSFRKLRFVDINKPFWKKLMYRAFSTAQKPVSYTHLGRSLKNVQSVIKNLKNKFAFIKEMCIRDRYWIDTTFANKGIGVRSICKTLDIALADVMAFGDNYNDVSMLDIVGVPYIMDGAAAPLREKYPNHTPCPEDVLREFLKQA